MFQMQNGIANAVYTMVKPSKVVRIFTDSRQYKAGHKGNQWQRNAASNNTNNPSWLPGSESGQRHKPACP